MRQRLAAEEALEPAIFDIETVNEEVAVVIVAVAAVLIIATATTARTVGVAGAVGVEAIGDTVVVVVPPVTADFGVRCACRMTGAVAIIAVGSPVAIIVDAVGAVFVGHAGRVARAVGVVAIGLTVEVVVGSVRTLLRSDSWLSPTVLLRSDSWVSPTVPFVITAAQGCSSSTRSDDDDGTEKVDPEALAVCGP